MHKWANDELELALAKAKKRRRIKLLQRNDQPCKAQLYRKSTIF